MSSRLAMSIMSAAEFLLVAIVAFLFWRRKLQRRFPAMSAYLGLRLASAPLFFLLLARNQATPSQAWYSVYFFSYWGVYIVSAGILFFICIEVFRSALSPFAGLMKFGIVIFRWIILASVIVTFSTISFSSHRGILIIPDIAFGMMHSVSILELCLLAFLCLCMNALRLSVRDVAFGISLGFGVMAANDFVAASVISRNISLTAPLQFVYESLILTALGVWTAYCAMPQEARKPVVMPANSTVYRWNEIASALGHTGTQVAVQQPANSFFLSDVEKVVDKVLNRNLKGRQSES
ncbi:MAG TPA: hypothetical protein VL991_03980 [Terracidiphilus sp.]|jgi:hypothetical protein|nr:hypothetical protein [Terracidiphilus sp.]